jgi:benzoate-CoA ligase
VGRRARFLRDQETGYLLIRGRSVTPGYWNRPEVNAEKIDAEGWFRTGDMYSLKDGYYSYQGREDDMLKVGGIWVSPVEIENVLMEHEAVNECAVVGQEIEGLIKPFAYVAPEKKYVATEKERVELSKRLLDFAGARLPKFKCPWGVHLTNELPKTATGKIQRFKLRAINDRAA